MTRRARLLVLALMTGLFLFPTAASAERVRHVIDGDTLVLDSGDKVRLIGIDAPEIENRKYGRRGEYFGEEARIYLRDLVEGRDVRLEAGQEPRDRYGRRLAFLYLDDLLVNREMVRLGFADVFRKFPFKGKEEFLRLESEAREAGRGLWQTGTGGRTGSKPFPWELVLLAFPVVALLYFFGPRKRA